MPKVTPLNCHRCGRFVGKGGDPDTFYDHSYGAWEVGYPRCARCVQEDLEASKQAAPFAVGANEDRPV